MKFYSILLFCLIVFSCNAQERYNMPSEDALHEATWLQWPHHHQYGEEFRDRLDNTWIAITKALIQSEQVNLVVYDEEEKERIISLLEKNNVAKLKIKFFEFQTNDFWARDNGPIYVKDENGKIVIQDWGFNAWGNKAKYSECNKIPALIGTEQNIKVLDLNDVMINEGGAVELDGHGTLLATKSAILNENRNPGMTKVEAEEIFSQYLGVSNFIWLEGKAGLEITDMHIDGFARFVNEKTLVTMSKNDLEEWSVPSDDIKTLYNCKNKNAQNYAITTLPLTKEEVVTEYGKELGYKGSYINYYIANTVVLVPNYKDENDAKANALIQKLYPTRKVIGIDVRNLYANGGMIHCVTQQQPK